MNTGGVNANYPMGYETKGTQKTTFNNDFAGKITDAAQVNGAGAAAVLHGSDEETGDIAVSSWADVVGGSSMTVYKTKDFDPENPVYKVKIWDATGNVTERMVDVSKINPKDCNTFEMYVYTANLKETGKGDFKETVLKAAIAKAASHLEQKTSAPWDYSRNINWVETVKDIMQTAYSYGDLKGYLEWKKFLGFLEPQSNVNKESRSFKKIVSENKPTESEDEFCSLCGSRLKPDGSCPICIVPTFISGNKRSFIQNVSQANSRNLTMPSRNLIQSKNK